MFVLAFCATPFLAQAQSSVDLKEWEVPWEKSGPRDPFAENKNTVWFVGQRSGYGLVLIQITLAAPSSSPRRQTLNKKG